jgi:uncharacterized membrane protein
MIRIGCLAAALFAPVIALAEPHYARVSGVASDDVLNIRAQPDAGSADIGDLAHDAVGIEVLGFDSTGDWARIGLGESDGWIASRFLEPVEMTTLGESSIPVGLSCSGTEPFWALGLQEATGTYSHPEDGDSEFVLDSVAVAEGYLGSPALVTLATEDSRVIEATILGAECSDGMSDRSYGWTVTMQLIAPGQRRFLTGCCHLPRN